MSILQLIVQSIVLYSMYHAKTCIRLLHILIWYSILNNTYCKSWQLSVVCIDQKMTKLCMTFAVSVTACCCHLIFNLYCKLIHSKMRISLALPPNFAKCLTFCQRSWAFVGLNSGFHGFVSLLTAQTCQNSWLHYSSVS